MTIPEHQPDLRLAPGVIVQTSYGTGPYRIKSVMRGCTCPSYLDEINDRPRATRPHVHLIVEDARTPGGKRYYLGYYDEASLQSVVSRDRLTIVDAVQMLLPLRP